MKNSVIKDETEKARAQILEALSLGYALLLIFVLSVHLAKPELLKLQPLHLWCIAVDIASSMASYGLSRSRHYAHGCSLFFIVNIGVGLAGIHFAPEELIVLATLTVMAAGSLVCSVVVSARHTAVLAGLALLLFFGEFLLLPPEYVRAFSMGLIVFGIFSVLAVTGALMRERLDRVVQAQQASLFGMAKLSSLGEMAGGVAHEINTPLAVITSAAAQMGELLGEDALDRAALSQMTSKIEKTGARIGKIVQGLRSISRDGGRDGFQPILVSQLIEETADFCRERFSRRQIRLSIEDRSCGAEIRGRETEISQVLLNLLNNAHDAVMDFQEKWVKIEAAAEGGRVRISVTDSGPGIPKKIQEKIFQPFFTTKAVGIGTGLGLSISHGIIQNHGGDLAIDASSEQTRFVFQLPIHAAKETLAA